MSHDELKKMIFDDTDDSVLVKCVSTKDKVVIPSTVRVIGPNAFKGLPLSAVHISENVRIISDYAFDGCDDLVYLTFDEGVTHIGLSAFRKRVGVTMEPLVKIPSTVIEIKWMAFEGRTNILAPTASEINLNVQAFPGLLHVFRSSFPLYVYGHTVKDRLLEGRHKFVIDMNRTARWGYRYVYNQPMIDCHNDDDDLYRFVLVGDKWAKQVLKWFKNDSDRPYYNTNELVEQHETLVMNQTPPGLTPRKQRGDTVLANTWDVETIPAGTQVQRLAVKKRKFTDVTFFAMNELQPHFVRSYLDSVEEANISKYFVYTFKTKRDIDILRINIMRRSVMKLQRFVHLRLDDFEGALMACCEEKNCEGWVGYSGTDNAHILKGPYSPETLLIHDIQWECALRNANHIIQEVREPKPFVDVLRDWDTDGHIKTSGDQWTALLYLGLRF